VEVKNLIEASKEELIKELWSVDPEIEEALKTSEDLREARERFYDYLNDLERHYFNIYSDRHFKDIHIVERNNAKECIRVLKNVIRTENEHLTGFSAMSLLFELSGNHEDTLDKVSEGFLCEFIFLFRGALGVSGVERVVFEHLSVGEGREAATNRSFTLDSYSRKIMDYMVRYRSGLERDIVKRREASKRKILRHLGGSKEDWGDYRWHLKNVVSDLGVLASMVKLDADEIEGLRAAERHDIPFQVTPYYLSLFEYKGRSEYDRSIRAQVIPSVDYCTSVAESRRKGVDLDFMGERSTSPVDGITRRYPQILILKPFDSCPQICVYCQRNWEIRSLEKSVIAKDEVGKAVDWIRGNQYIREVLVTGGDPLTLGNEYLAWLMRELSRIKHVERIRIGTRVPVTLPFRIDEGFLKIIKAHHEWGRREVCIMTHIEHPAEVTPDCLSSVKKLKALGINVYNQQVFTYYNSRRFETCALRRILKLIGIDPYYCFNTKGKEETMSFRVPIARIEQERKEEARLLPGLLRMDKPVFNVPRLGKSNLRAWQDHEPIMILADGKRVYRFYPWESKFITVDTYMYTDVSIYDYLKRLAGDGEDIREYTAIWYYF
jgi:lysine 2,3-aminomutase